MHDMLARAADGDTRWGYGPGLGLWPPRTERRARTGSVSGHTPRPLPLGARARPAGGTPWGLYPRGYAKRGRAARSRARGFVRSLYMRRAYRRVTWSPVAPWWQGVSGARRLRHVGQRDRRGLRGRANLYAPRPESRPPETPSGPFVSCGRRLTEDKAKPPAWSVAGGRSRTTTPRPAQGQTGRFGLC